MTKSAPDAGGSGLEILAREAPDARQPSEDTETVSLNLLCSLDLAVLLDLLDLARQPLALGSPPVQGPSSSDERLEGRLPVCRVSSSC